MLFTFLSLFSVLFFRPLLMKKMQAGLGEVEVDRLVGERALVRDEIDPGGWGKAELRGTTWKVRNAGETPYRAGPIVPC